MANEIAKRDQNDVPVITGITDDAAQEIRMIRVNPATGRVLVSATGGTSTGTYYTVSGTINSVNKTFTIATAVASDFLLFLGRQPQMKTTDFTYSAGGGITTITYVTAPDISLSTEPHVAFVIS